MGLETARHKLVVIAFAIGLCYGSVYLGNAIVRSPNIGLAILVGLIPAAVCVWLILKGRDDSRFLLRVFIAALALRWIVAFWIHLKHLQPFFGGDAESYDFFGNALLQSWQGLVDPSAPWLTRYTGAQTPGWGMYYFVAGIYYVIGRNPLAIQLINAAFGAGACVAGYKISMMVYPNERVARGVALMSAFSPSLVLWTSQGLKDGPIIICLCLCALLTLKVRARVEIKSFLLLLLFLGGLYTLRHYAAYIMFVAITGTLIFTTRRKFTPVRMLQAALLVIVLGLAFSYFGAGEVAKSTFDFERVQRSRLWNAKAANSGFGGDVDITDPEAAISFLPVGTIYVLFAPFPWMMNNLRQFITLPELIVWWCLMPIMFKGYWFVIRNRLRQSFVLCTFVLGLTLAFALYQSNAGTAYRHRSQLYVFFFVFICIGLELRRTAKQQNRTRFARPVPLGVIYGTPTSQGLAADSVKQIS